MSIIDFTRSSCKNKDMINKQITENFEKFFAMYGFTNIKEMPNVKVSRNGDYFIIEAEQEECDNIVNSLSKFKSSHFQNTLSPKFSKLKNGLKVEFTIDGE